MQQRLTRGQGFIALVICAVPLVFGFIIPVSLLINWAIDTYADVLGKDFYLLLFHSLLLAFITSALALGYSFVHGVFKQK